MVYIKNELTEAYEAVRDQLPPHTLNTAANKTSFSLEFQDLADRDAARKVLGDHDIRFRAGKTLVPFRLTGNIEWGVPAPVLEGEEGLTIWVWPESLWAPVSFTRTYLKQQGREPEAWKQFWCSKDAQVYQFIGQDNIYFYGIAEMVMFMAAQGKGTLTIHPEEGQLTLPTLVANNHILFLNKKASSSGAVKPPMAEDLLAHYTPEQLRAHFLGLGLGLKSVSFQPKPLNPAAGEKDADPVLKEGKLLSNVFNRVARSCFYTAQKYCDGKLPFGPIDEDVRREGKETILKYERYMYRFEFHSVMNLMDTYIRNANKYWAKHVAEADRTDDNELRMQVLRNVFHMVRVAAVLMHPVAPAAPNCCCPIWASARSSGTGTAFLTPCMISAKAKNTSSNFWNPGLTFSPCTKARSANSINDIGMIRNALRRQTAAKGVFMNIFIFFLYTALRCGS